MAAFGIIEIILNVFHDVQRFHFLWIYVYEVLIVCLETVYGGFKGLISLTFEEKKLLLYNQCIA
ncbi:hypothetical protein C1646_775734 [Rhizophagus diaphanus]|nr:hypothetical protein C1646_775734 [Rhizophagus diaphanus] [Rhizophagus sp. MUCL 43196]